jgi:hypothetical protein
VSELEARLADLAERLGAPDAPGLRAEVTARLRAERPARRRRWWRWAAGGAVVVAGVGLSPAVADLLGVGGVSVKLSPPPTPSTLAPSDPPVTMPPLDLGTPVPFADAAARAGFRPVVPAVLGPPPEVWVDRRSEAPLLWMRWPGGPLVMEVAGGMPSMPVVQKFAPDATIRWVRAGDRPALWIDGVHQIVVAEVDGSMIVQRLRTVDSTLLVQVGPVTVRVETTRGLAEALRVAASLPGT